MGGVQPQELFVAFLTIVYNKDAVASHKDITVVRKHVLASPSQTDVLFKSIDPSVFCLAITEMPFFTSSMRLWQMVRGNESDIELRCISNECMDQKSGLLIVAVVIQALRHTICPDEPLEHSEHIRFASIVPSRRHALFSLILRAPTHAAKDNRTCFCLVWKE